MLFHRMGVFTMHKALERLNNIKQSMFEIPVEDYDTDADIDYDDLDCEDVLELEEIE